MWRRFFRLLGSIEDPFNVDHNNKKVQLFISFFKGKSDNFEQR
tara:strand:+ start:14195 stop:14323 length:129 start_codon:yes stop_codon:yes gene_type:complete